VRADIPHEYRTKVLPFGLNYACRTPLSVLTAFNVFAPRFRLPCSWKNYLLSPSPRTFEVSPCQLTRPSILFQTRLWSRSELAPSDSPEEINGTRVKLVRELKRAFGPRFRGGLVPSKEASYYPDLITSVATRRWQYAASSRDATIGIYTRGLHGSNAFKLAEYLAGAKCIVGESLAHDLPLALEECHRRCETIEGIVAECDVLLSNDARLQDLRRASSHYYHSYLRYDRRLRLLLRAASDVL
jgi:hypothetical protein